MISILYNRISNFDWLLDGFIFMFFVFIVSTSFKFFLKIPSIGRKILRKRDAKIDRILNDDVLLYAEISLRNTLLGTFISAVIVQTMITGSMIAYYFINFSPDFYFENEMISLVTNYSCVIILILEVFTIFKYMLVRDILKRRQKITSLK